ncbi:MAG: hypothetical protein ACI4OT_04215 [Bacilli bacterium]
MKNIESNIINIYIKVDIKNKMIYISDHTKNKSGGGLAKSFKRKNELKKIISNYVENYINLYEVNYD